MPDPILDPATLPDDRAADRPTLLVTGASGFLGWNLCRVARDSGRWRAVGLGRSRTVAIPGVAMQTADLTDATAIAALLDATRPAAVIHAAAQGRPNWCQLHPDESRTINVDATLTLADRCAERDIPLVFTSTDLVFDGRNPPYRETDPVSPVCLYGEQKVEAEQGLLVRHPRAIACRMPLMFGAVPPGASSFLQPFLETLRSGEVLNAFIDEIRTPVSGTTAARGLLLALERGAPGRLHLGGREVLSRYEFARQLAAAFDLPDCQVQPGRQADLPMSAPRSPDTSLDSRRAFALGYDPPPVAAELAELRASLDGN